ncbi:MAG TPA: prolyl oligopeptidase family serine peptidase, partial [Chitinophagaceae bacterium]|nr:prolyl oligopeptidase family serine peptidase [Chitinophagaceae bacterium]
REAVYTDPLAYQLYTRTLKTPAEGDAFGSVEKGEAPVWQPVTADTARRLMARGQGRGGGFGRTGYLYLTYTSDRERTALLQVSGNSGLYFNGVPHAGDPYRSGWLQIPVALKKGLTELYVRGLNVTASLHFPQKSVLFQMEDATLPTILPGSENEPLQGAVVVINTTGKDLKGLQVKSRMMGKEVVTTLPAIPALSFRKVPFYFDAGAVTEAGKVDCNMVLLDKGKTLDEATVAVEAVAAGQPYSRTFISAIDGSLQYYAVTPQAGAPQTNTALFLSVHGAGVEAIGQARAYAPKDWGNLVAATNRRPRGFNWEDWGRLDALEVLERAKERFRPDPKRIYLTGHSMGGHGTWFLGATYPDKWAAIAPCAGYPTLKGYGSADGLIPDSSSDPVEQMLLRSSNQSDVVRLAANYKPMGVYVFHGDADPVVSVNYARQMRKVLADFHTDLSYYEYPGGSHWFGNESVDWKPIFDFFRWHRMPEDTAVHTLDFTTASPGISAAYHWASVHQQLHPLAYSRIRLKANQSGISGTTENVRLLLLDLKRYAPGDSVRIALDGSAPFTYVARNSRDSIFLVRENGSWKPGAAPDRYQKGPHRYGTLKDAFRNRMVFVYSTAGTPEENEWSRNKARYDAETWYYRGNGAVDLIADRDFSLAAYKDRGVILYGNRSTNRAWNVLLQDCPIQVERNRITAGRQVWQGADLGAHFVWPIRGSSVASVGVVSGTNLKGMGAADANQYFAGASGFPDYMIFGLDMLQQGVKGVKLAGFFSADWKLSEEDQAVGD